MMELAVVFEALLLSIGLAYRINQIRLENIRISNEKKEDQRKFYKALISVEEKEKRRLGRLLHDGIGHDLLLLKNLFKASSPDVKEEEVLDQIDQLGEKVRDISHLFHPLHLEQLGFTLAAEQLIESTFENSDIECMSAIADIDLPRHIELEFFHVLQECLNNIMKHSNASEAIIRFGEEMVNKQEMAVLRVKDDGMGFQHLGVNDDNGMGLTMIQEGIDTLGGIFNINRSQENGTEIKVCIPVQCSA
jgi:signal transduction histidine kinase